MNNSWEKFYKEVGENAMMKYPFAIVMKLISYYINHNPHINVNEINILELGCGSGVNLKYAAELGCNVYGIDISKTAINYVKKMFKNNNLHGYFQVASVDELPFEKNFFNIIIDHGALVCVNEKVYIKAIEELYRVIKTQGVALLTPYSEISSKFLKLYKDNNDTNNFRYKNKDIFINNIGLYRVIDILNNRFKVVYLSRIDRTMYDISNDNKIITNMDTECIYEIFIEKI